MKEGQPDGESRRKFLANLATGGSLGLSAGLGLRGIEKKIISETPKELAKYLDEIAKNHPHTLAQSLKELDLQTLEVLKRGLSEQK